MFYHKYYYYYCRNLRRGFALTRKNDDDFKMTDLSMTLVGRRTKKKNNFDNLMEKTNHTHIKILKW